MEKQPPLAIHLIFALLLALMFPFFITGAIEEYFTDTDLWSYRISCVGFGISTFYLLVWGMHNREDIDKEINRSLAAGDDITDYTVVLPAFHFGFFVLLCKNLAADGYFIYPKDATLWHWIFYGIDNTIRVVLMDIPEIYNIKYSKIYHNAEMFWASTLIFTYRLTLSIGLIKILVLTYKKVSRKA
ncbi:hypothetical protein [Candidatus Uabimicrobium amorphum]|uniref:Uncharacterized protein n=1 Tax=Uabimicrobium amorphum TaxID=2596890 RepID=A0A5S9F135_UABAM|nr:hypothetical protein [Candidatus Uabimicrobium amorphum]BBM82146.1 hypothetical protein UABAM_00489 [Candidatus Uabimicrobium amorphum]